MFFGGILLRTFILGTFLYIRAPDAFYKAENQGCSLEKYFCGFIEKHKESPSQIRCKVVTKLVKPVVLNDLTDDPKLANQWKYKPPEILDDGKPNGKIPYRK